MSGIVIDYFRGTRVGVRGTFDPRGCEKVQTFIYIVRKTGDYSNIAFVWRDNANSGRDFSTCCGARGQSHSTIGGHIYISATATSATGSPDGVIEVSAPGQNLLVRGNVAVKLRICNVVLI